MSNFGYYELENHLTHRSDLKASVIAGNVQFNRLHWHENLEIICCIYGEISIAVNNETYRLKSGDLLTIDRNLRHEIFDSSPQGLQLIFAVDSSLLLSSNEERYCCTTVGNNSLPANHKDICMIREGLAKLACMMMPNTIANTLNIEEQWHQFHMELYRIMMHLSRHKVVDASKCSATTPFSYFTRCIEIIHKHYDQPLTVQSLSQQAGFSEASVYRLFKKHMGVSPNHYLNSIRISMACGLLENTDYSMTTIAEQCGFSSLSNFYRAFQQFMPLSPLKYRKQPGCGQHLTNDVQKDILLLNRFQPIWETNYTCEHLKQVFHYPH